jgi:hypothetical protein
MTLSEQFGEIGYLIGKITEISNKFISFKYKEYDDKFEIHIDGRVFNSGKDFFYFTNFYEAKDFLKRVIILLEKNNED